MTSVVYTCPYVPAEWIVAHGLRPERMTLSARTASLGAVEREGVCPFVRAFVGHVAQTDHADAIVMTTACDQMRRAFDLVQRHCSAPAFLLNVPRTWRTAAAANLYLEEIKRLGEFLVGIGGQAPSRDTLIETMRRYNESPATDRLGRPSRRGVPVAVIGGPLVKEDAVLFDLLYEYGAYPALDATESGARSLPRSFDEAATSIDPLRELAAAYFEGIEDPARRPNDRFYEWLGRKLTALKVRGIVLFRYVWCDIWHAEVGRLRRWTPLPVLDLDADGQGPAGNGRMRTRIGAFVEMLR